MTLQCLHEEESKRRHPLRDGAGVEFFLLQKIALKPPDVIWAQLIRRLVEVLGELPDCQQVRPYGSLRVITTLEFLQHHSSEMGHRDLLVTQNTATFGPLPLP